MIISVFDSEQSMILGMGIMDIMYIIMHMQEELKIQNRYPFIKILVE